MYAIKVDEFYAIGYGGLYLLGKSSASVITQVFKKLEILHNVKFNITNDSVFSIAIRTIIYYKKFLQ